MGKALKGRGIKMLITSDLPRAEETAKIVSKESGIPIMNTTPDLRTWDPGIYENSSLKGSDKILRYYVLQHPDERPKGSSESRNEFARRVTRKMNQLMDISIDRDVIIGVLTHHWPVELIKEWCAKGRPGDVNKLDWEKILFGKEDPPGTVYDMRLSAKGKWAMPVVPPGTNFHPGPVIIRHEQTAKN